MIGLKSKTMLKKLGFKRDIDGTWLNNDSETRITLEDGYLLLSGEWADESSMITPDELKAIVEYCLDEKFIDGYEEKKWIPFKLRSCDEDEKKEYGTDQIWDVPLPDNGEQILVSDAEEVWEDMFVNDAVGCNLEMFCGNLKGLAWMRMPDVWKEGSNDS